MEQTPLEKIIKDTITSEGPLTVHDYMDLCLQHPEHGYYRHATALGSNGDFVTAPEISQLFGELVGIWCLVVWEQLGSPAKLNLVELGPGRGTLMADILRVGRLRQDFLAAVTLSLVESNPTLRASQKNMLAPTGIAPTWLENISDIAQSESPTLLIANEFVDATPVHQFIKVGDGWHERTVELTANGTLDFAHAPAATTLPATKTSDHAAGTIRETRPASEALTRHLAVLSKHAPVTALLIDYGYGDSEIGETLQALSKHKPVSLFNRPGECDLTAHVDFADLAQTAEANGLLAHPLINQAQFLGQMGIVERLEQLTAGADAKTLTREQTGAARLISPDAMGSLFKVLAITSKSIETLPAFEFSK